MSASSSVAVVLLVHNQPAQVRRVLEVLDPLPVLLHCDASASDADFAAMLAGAGERVTALERRHAWRCSWSLLEIELRGLKAALQRTTADYIVLMSGACYPLLSVPALEAELASTPGQSRLDLWPLPYEPWATRLGYEGGLWRLRLRVLGSGGRPVTLGGRPIPVGPARIPADLEPHGASAWKVYARQDARRLLEVLDAHPELVRFFRSSWLPEESCVPSILKSTALVGDRAEAIKPSAPWYLHFPTSAAEGQDPHGHPDVMTDADVAPMGTASEPAFAGHDHLARALFARKFMPGSGALLDRVDRELRSRP